MLQVQQFSVICAVSGTLPLMAPLTDHNSSKRVEENICMITASKTMDVHLTL